MNVFAIIPKDLNYNLMYRTPIGFVVHMSYGIPGKFSRGTIIGKGKTVEEAVLSTLGSPLCPLCGGTVTFLPEADNAFCQTCVAYPDVSSLAWERVDGIRVANRQGGGES